MTQNSDKIEALNRNNFNAHFASQTVQVSQEVSDKYRKDEKDDGLVSATVAHQPN